MIKTLDECIDINDKRKELFIAISLGLLAFLVPTFLAKLINIIFGVDSFMATHSQLIVGSIVNTALVISALYLKGWKKILLIVTMPSISTIFSGYIFKTASIYMVYMIPFIWLGNLALIYVYKSLFINKNKNYFLTGIIGIILKVLIIFGFFSLLNICGVFPSKLVPVLKNAMGYIQAITASIGVVLAYFIYKLNKRA